MPGAAARSRATTRSSKPQLTGTSVRSLPNTVRPTFWTTNWSPSAEMTPIWQGPLSAVTGGFAVALAFCACFLTAGLVTGGTACVAVVPGAGWLCAQAHDTKHDSATATNRIMNTPGRTGSPKTAQGMDGGMVRKQKARACLSHPQVFIYRTVTCFFHR